MRSSVARVQHLCNSTTRRVTGSAMAPVCLDRQIVYRPTVAAGLSLRAAVFWFGRGILLQPSLGLPHNLCRRRMRTILNAAVLETHKTMRS